MTRPRKLLFKLLLSPALVALVNAYNCHEGPVDSWCAAKKAYCCQQEHLGCPPDPFAARQTFDCTEDGDESNWSVPRRAFCCEHHQTGCPSHEAVFDCDEDYAIWTTAWSPEKQIWCCRVAARGCTGGEVLDQPEPAPAPAPAPVVAAKAGCDSPCVFHGVARSCSERIEWGAKHKFRGHVNPCKEAHDLVVRLCSSCSQCLLEDTGCSVPVAYDCNSDPEEWHPEQQAWCCTNKGKGCEPPAPAAAAPPPSPPQQPQAVAAFDCEADWATWTTSWDNEKRAWCCRHVGRGCAPPPSAFDQGSPASACDTKCTYHGFTQTCKARIQWAASHSLLDRPDPCSEAHSLVLRQCDCCRSCSLEDAGCLSVAPKVPIPHLTPHDCDEDFDDWQEAWSPAKQRWCCERTGRGCSTAQASVAPSNDLGCDTPCQFLGDTRTCRARIQWTANHRFFGSHHACEQARGHVLEQCPVCGVCRIEDSHCTPRAPYDCDSELENWERAWPADKKDWCCRFRNKGCPMRPTSAPHYDCDAGFAMWETMWSDQKKAWCCENAERGCPQTAAVVPEENLGCDTKCVHKDLTASCRSRIQWAASHTFKDRGNPCSEGYDFVVQHCPVCGVCALEDSRCFVAKRPGALQVQTCSGPEETWDMTKRIRCCQQEGKGCPTPPPPTFNCDEDPVESWPDQKKDWCCANANKGCAPPPAGCDVLCHFKGATRSCRSRIQYTAIHKFSERADPCGDAHSLVLQQCPCCARCFPQDSGCVARPPPPAPERFDCEADFATWQRSWDVAKKIWCCQHFQRGCPSMPPASELPPPGPPAPAEEVVPAPQLSLGCSTLCSYHGLVRSCSSRIQYAATHKFAGRRDSCVQAHTDVLRQCACCAACQLEDSGCAQVAAAPTVVSSSAFQKDCDVGFANWVTEWDATKKQWCCEQQGRGCSAGTLAPTTTVHPEPFKCFDGKEATWYDEKRLWCCEHRQKGCLSNLPPKTPCDVVCFHDRHRATCRSRVLWAADNSFATDPNRCRLAHTLVLEECPSCSECSLELTGCRGPPSTRVVHRSFRNYDCEAEKEMFETAWSPHKQAWCCQERGVGCSAATCEGTDGAWSAVRRSWCCTNQGLGCLTGSTTPCPSQASTQAPNPTLVPVVPITTTAPVVVASTTQVLSQDIVAPASNDSLNATVNSTTDANATADSTSEAPTSTPTPVATTEATTQATTQASTEAAVTTTPPETTAATTTQTTAAPSTSVATTAETSTGAATTTPCPTSTVATVLTTAPAPLGCASTCKFQGGEATCGDHIQRVALEAFPNQTDACELAYDAVLQECPYSCSMCDPTNTGCGQAPPAFSYDCTTDQTAWGNEQKSWCCTHHGVACPQVVTYDCTGTQDVWPAVQKEWCCANANVGCTTSIATGPDAFDCDAGFFNWETSWTEAQKTWCCAHKNRGCTVATDQNCTEGTVDQWCATKRAMCCQLQKIGCPDTAPLLRRFEAFALRGDRSALKVPPVPVAWLLAAGVALSAGMAVIFIGVRFRRPVEVVRDGWVNYAELPLVPPTQTPSERTLAGI